MSEETKIPNAQYAQTLEERLEEAEKEINRLKLEVRAGEIRVGISSEYTNFGLWEYDIAQDICYQYKKLDGRYSGNLQPIVGFRETVLGWGSVYAEDIPVFNRMCDAMERGDSEIRCDVRCMNDNCDLVWFRYEGKTLYDDNGKPLRIIGRTLDVTRLKGGIGASSDERRDSLTGVFTYDAFRTDVLEKTSGVNRYSGCALLFISIDGFDELLKSEGETAADEVLKSVAKILANLSACERGSCVGRAGGGDLLMYVRVEDTGALNGFLSKLVGMIGDYPYKGGRSVSVSVGAALITAGTGYSETLGEAELAAKAVKAKGGGGFARYDAAMSAADKDGGAGGRLPLDISQRGEKDRRSRLLEAIVKNLRVEGYTIDPVTYETDYVGFNAAAHYGLKKGDICYKKIRGLDAPCPDCPTKRLAEGRLFAQAALYFENEHRWSAVSASADDGENGKQWFICASDITDCLGMINSVDTLTGVMTMDMFSAEMMRLTAENAKGYFVAVFNIANFRRINEEMGYEFGNSVLIAVADILSASVRPGELLCRSEGSRFIALFKNKDYAELEVRLNQLLASIQKQVYSRCARQIYLLVGVYRMGEEPDGFMGALDKAIRAQKTIKDRTFYRENLIAPYDSKLKEELRNKQYVESHMVKALANGEFKVYYQPKVSIASGTIVGAEALVRWIRPDGRIISPAMFVPIFEENGFITDMDFAIYRDAVADIKRWLRNGLSVPLISLNVSRHHLRDDNFAGKLSSLVDSLGVPRDKIELEITESLLADNINKLVEIMTSLKKSGFRISVDDFGAGYSSLNLITLLPFDTLKIDGGFFLKNELTDKNKKVISSVVTLAKSLNLETVSEGVETISQVDFLRGLGCDMIQGYYYYKPMPSDDFEKLLSFRNVGAR